MEQVYKSMDIRFSQANLDLAFTAMLSGNQWNFKVHDHNPNQEYKVVYEGNLQETIELILLGKVLKAQLRTIDKAEPVSLDIKAEMQGKALAYAQSEKQIPIEIYGHPTHPDLCTQIVYVDSYEEFRKIRDIVEKLGCKCLIADDAQTCDLCGKTTPGENPHYDCTQKESYASEAKS